MEYDDRYRQVQRPNYDCLLFDLDDTLYPLSSGLASAVLGNIQDYMTERLGIEQNKIPDLCNLLYKNYGTTMAGLRAIGYDFDYDEYHSFVHGRLPYENLKPDPVLRSLLLSLPIRKVIFTNADKVHAVKVLSRLGLEDCFEGILCFETLNPIHKSSVSDDEDDIEFLGSKRSSTASNGCHQIFDIIGHFSRPNEGSDGLPKTPVVCKPSESAIKRALEIANINPHRTLFFEDSVRNIQSGKHVDLHTVLPHTEEGKQTAPSPRSRRLAVRQSPNPSPAVLTPRPRVHGQQQQEELKKSRNSSAASAAHRPQSPSPASA